MDLLKYIGGRIRELRQSYGGGDGISQDALAQALGVAKNTISRWETATHRPSILLEGNAHNPWYCCFQM